MGRRNSFPKGVWVAIIALMFSGLAWGMQAFSLLNWEMAVKFGLQNENFDGNIVEQALANVERGVALADMVWALPLTILAFIGLIRLKFYGLFTGAMVFAISIYFPLFFAFQRWETHRETAIFALLLFALPSLIGIFALWSNRNAFLNRNHV